MHRRQTLYTNRTFKSLQFGVFYRIFKRTVDFLRFFCATKVVWTCIHAYGGEWVNYDLILVLVQKNDLSTMDSKFVLCNSCLRCEIIGPSLSNSTFFTT